MLFFDYTLCIISLAFEGEPDVTKNERPRLKELLATRNIAMWHDHSEICGRLT